MRLPMVYTMSALINLVDEIGFLPFFQNEIPGFSVEECTPEELWFTKGVEGPWEWREELAQSKSCIYAKLYHGRTGLASKEWFPHLANYRRDGYDFDARWDDGMANYRDKQIVDLIVQHGAILSTALRDFANVDKKKAYWFESAMTRLQMRCYVLPVNFAFARDRNGRKYGYGTALFDLPERWLGDEFCTSEYHTDPQHSYARIQAHLKKQLPDASDTALRKLIEIR